MAQLDISEISRRLSTRAEEVCGVLLPGGKRAAQYWEVGGVNGESGKSMKVTVAGDHAGKWKDFAEDSMHGDLIDLWEQTRGVTKLEALRQIKAFLGIVEIEPERKKVWQQPPSAEQVKKIADNGAVMKFMVDERKLEPSIVNRFRIMGDGKNIVFPSYGPDDKLVNRSYRQLALDENGKKRVWQDKGCAPCLWGWHALDKSTFDRREILICEGQIDAMTWTQWGIPALSVPNGSGNTWIEYEWENLSAFSTIYFSYDSDGKTSTQLAEAVKRLGIHRCRIVQLPHKDANDALKAGCGAEDARKWIAESKWTPCEGLAEGVDYRKQVLEQFFPKPDDAKGIRLKLLSRYDGGVVFLPGDVTVWTGVTSHGKSTLLNFLFSLLLCDNHGVFIASLEMKPAKIIKRMFHAMLGTAEASHQDIEDCFTQSAGKLFFANRIGCIEQSELFELMRFAFSRYGVKNFLIDSLMRISGLEEDYPAQGEFMNKLQKFTKETGVHAHLVCHPRKVDEANGVGKMDIKGASLIPNNADNIVSVRRNFKKMEIMKERALTAQEDLAMWDALVSCEKDREEGWQGSVYLRFCPKTYRFQPFS